MKRPIENIPCPFCPSKKPTILKTDKFKYYKKWTGELFEGDWWVYECLDCGEKFTTTESDTISQNNLKITKL
jgi:hypothetical protein